MYLVTCFVLALLIFESHAAAEDKSALCATWDRIERSLNNEKFQLQFTCTKDEGCQSLNCSGTAHGYYVNSRIQLYACENSPSIEFELNIPKLNINNLKKRIYHNDSISITKSLDVEFKVQRKDQELVLGIFLHYLNNGSFPVLRIPVTLPIISDVGFPINCPSLKAGTATTEQSVDVSKAISMTSFRTTKSFLVVPRGGDEGYSNCSVTNSSCGEDEICQQASKDQSAGICVCLLTYKRDKSGKCVYDPALDTTTEGPDHNPVKPDKKETSNVSLLLTAILVPISVIVILVALVYASIRFRVFQHLRRRLRVQVYEHVLLGEDDEEEEDLTNPVA